MQRNRSLYDPANIARQSQVGLRTEVEHLPHVYPSGNYPRPWQLSEDHRTEDGPTHHAAVDQPVQIPTTADDVPTRHTAIEHRRPRSTPIDHPAPPPQPSREHRPMIQPSREYPSNHTPAVQESDKHLSGKTDAPTPAQVWIEQTYTRAGEIGQPRGEDPTDSILIYLMASFRCT